jgi:methionine aminopeptidase type I
MYVESAFHLSSLAKADHRQAYPSPLNYNHFPKSVCTSVNEVICHGIPDQRVLLDGDIINLDVTLYHEGYHGDLNETYYVGDRAKADPDSVRVVETARECLEEAIKLVKPGTLFREFGNVIEAHAKSRGCSVIRTYVGHGINTIFHCPPNIPHYAKNKAVGECKPGMTFTIEPMIALGKYRDVTWPDNWTSTTIDGKRTAQFGKLFGCSIKVFALTGIHRAYVVGDGDGRRGSDGAQARFSWRTRSDADPGAGDQRVELREFRGDSILGALSFIDHLRIVSLS